MTVAGEGPVTPWRRGSWRGVAAPAAGDSVDVLLAHARAPGGRQSRHARTRAVHEAGRRCWVKSYPSPGARFAERAFRMHLHLATAGFAVPSVLLFGRSKGEGVLVTEDVGGEVLLNALAARADVPREKRRLLVQVGSEIARLHRAGFVAGDLVPTNVIVRGRDVVLLDHDRTRRSRLLVWWHGRRNLVQLGRFVVPGLTLTDRARVLMAYAAGRRWSRRRRRRLARWLVRKITARRAAIDGITSATVEAVGFRELMRSGGEYDPGRTGAP